MRFLTGQSLVRNRHRWKIAPIADDRVHAIQDQLGVSAPVARILAHKVDGGDPKALLKNDITTLFDPALMHGIKPAVERIKSAIENQERIFIHGDFDVDGITSASLLYRALKRLGAEHLKVEIEDRERGHGLNDTVIQQIISEKFDLLITTDCGVSDYDLVKKLAEHDIDTVITDHHHAPDKLPPASAVVNPKQADCSYPNPDLAAVGVIYQVVSALFDQMGRNVDEVKRYLDLVMLGTLGDLVPLVAQDVVENRLFVSGGLDMLAQDEGTLGLQVLIKKLSLDQRKLTSGEISYVVIPKLNAANRVGDPRVSFLLLTTNDREKAEHLASTLLDYNYDRQVAQVDLRGQAIERVREEIDLKKDKIIIIAGSYWNPGVLGLVASDLADRYHRPTILLAKGDEFARASGRSIPEFDMIQGLVAHEHLFERYGGHFMAAGFSIQNNKIDQLKEELGAYARDNLIELETPTHSIEAEIHPDEISLDVFHEIQVLGPFGVGNREPRFFLRNVTVDHARVVGADGRHLKLKINLGAVTLDSIGFSLGDFANQVYEASQVDLVVKLSRDNWNGRSKIQLELIDILEPLQN
jgi:single-stranded-DNA-specific exonuclease